MKGKIIRGIAGMAAAVLAVISVNESVFAQNTGTVLLSYPEDTGTVPEPDGYLYEPASADSDALYDNADNESVVSADLISDTIISGIADNNENASSALKTILEKKDIMAVVYLTDECNVYSEPCTDPEIITRVREGETVYIKGAAFAENMDVMFLVSVFTDGTEYTGYVEAKNLIYSDEDLRD